jgi:hypothetical protein
MCIWLVVSLSDSRDHRHLLRFVVATTCISRQMLYGAAHHTAAHGTQACIHCDKQLAAVIVTTTVIWCDSWQGQWRELQLLRCVPAASCKKHPINAI